MNFMKTLTEYTDSSGQKKANRPINIDLVASFYTSISSIQGGIEKYSIIFIFTNGKTFIWGFDKELERDETCYSLYENINSIIL